MSRLFLATLLAAGSASAAQGAPDISGNWVVQDKSAVIAIGPCGNYLCGKIAKALVRKPGYPQTDIHNPDPALRRRPLIGLQILSGFVASPTQWDQGRIYDPESGRTYRSVLTLNADGSLKVSGCIAFICKSQRWTKTR